MGASCCAGARDKYDLGVEKGARVCGTMQKTVRQRMDSAKENLIIARIKASKKFDDTKLRVKGYSLYADYVDKGPFSYVTEFEINQYPICRVPLDNYEKRLQSFVRNEKTHIMSFG